MRMISIPEEAHSKMEREIEDLKSRNRYLEGCMKDYNALTEERDRLRKELAAAALKDDVIRDLAAALAKEG